MKIKYILICTAFLNAAIYVHGSDFLPQRIGKYEIETNLLDAVNQLPTIEGRVDYLQTIIRKTRDSSAENNFKIASAIRLLGNLHSTNAIAILASNIDFQDTRYHNEPSVSAIISIGDAAVPQLLEIVKKPRRVAWARNAVEALMKIKGGKYIEFVNEQKGSLPAPIWERLCWYAFHTEVPPNVVVYPLPQRVRNFEIESNILVRANAFLDVDQRRNYLESVVKNTDESTSEGNFQVSSAIRLLGVIHSTNSIPVLASKIDFEDGQYRNNPTPLAMAAMGEAAVSQLIEIIKEPQRSKRTHFAAAALVQIKGVEYFEFVDEQKNSLPAEIWKRFLQVSSFDFDF